MLRRTPPVRGASALILAAMLLPARARRRCSRRRPRTGRRRRSSAPATGCRPRTRASRATPPRRSPAATPHTAQTFAIGTLPGRHRARTTRLGGARHAGSSRRCETAFARFLGADESLAMRVQLSWAWFRPSERGWDKGARWYRCDLVGGPAGATAYADLPASAQGPVPGRPARAVADLRAGPTRAEVEEGALHRAARLARGHHDQGRPARRTPTPATGSCRCGRATSARTRSAPG